MDAEIPTKRTVDAPQQASTGWMNIPDEIADEELPFN